MGAILGILASALASACAEDDPKPPPASNETTSGGPTPAPQPTGATCTFAPTPSDFALPVIPGLPVNSFRTVTGKATCTNGAELVYELRDMNGDRQPDLLIRSACDDTTIGPLAWRVHFNTGAGFDANAVRFELPLPRPPACAVVEFTDVDGDLRPYLLTT